MWKHARKICNEKHNEFTGKASWSDLVVFKTIMKNIPSRCTLHFGNSSPIRYGQLFHSNAKEYYSNRGVSGIDGCVSTAAGIASQQSNLNLLIVGDLSFVYDSNGLWNKNFPSNLKIIVINNQGGGIFRMIPGPSDMEGFKEFMETEHPVKIRKIAEAFDLDYDLCEEEKDLEIKFKHFLQSKTGPALLEVRTPKQVNAEVYRTYVENFKKKDKKIEDG
jgi:2-succinyl-5-enolpyruvyl-6-hydroxy-3-cyclohexene-1-carboxylate synthase